MPTCLESSANGGRQGGGCWTWRQRRGGQWHQSQPDYCMARDEDVKLFRNIAIQWPRIHDSDQRAIVALIRRGRSGQLWRYLHDRLRFPLQLPPVEEQDGQTSLFGELRKTCEEEAPPRRQQNDWISEESWRLIAHRAMLRRTGRLCQAGPNRRIPLQGSSQSYVPCRGVYQVRTHNGECS